MDFCAARDQMIREHIPYARKVARNAMKRFPPWIDRDDVEQDAMLGLIAAADAYNPARGYAFVGFARRHVRGAIVDGIRRNDAVGRDGGFCFCVRSKLARYLGRTR